MPDNWNKIRRDKLDCSFVLFFKVAYDNSKSIKSQRITKLVDCYTGVPPFADYNKSL